MRFGAPGAALGGLPMAEHIGPKCLHPTRTARMQMEMQSWLRCQVMKDICFLVVVEKIDFHWLGPLTVARPGILSMALTGNVLDIRLLVARLPRVNAIQLSIWSAIFPANPFWISP